MSKTKYDPVIETFVEGRSDLLALACSLVDHVDTAEDIIQESWLRWQSKNYPAEQVKPIVVRIIKNLAADWHRHRAVEQKNFKIHAMLRGQSPDTERVVIARQQLHRVVAALKELPEQSVEAFRLNRMEGLTFSQIGQRLGVSRASAHRLAAQALIRIVQHLDHKQS